MKFNNCVGNPPYNYPKIDGKSTGNVLWPSFVKRSIGAQIPRSGSLTFVHPSIWRKPVDENSDVRLWETLSSGLVYLNINDAKTGQEVFGANTKFDWYVWKADYNGLATVNDINGNETEIDLSEWSFLPNSHFELIQTLKAGRPDEKQKIIFDSSYHASRSFVTDKKDLAHCHPVVHSTAGGQNIKYSDRQDRGHFGVPKLIIGESGIGEPILDVKGEYGMTQGAMGLHVESEEEGKKMLEALQSEKMSKILNACQWSGFRIDPRLFRQFQKNWQAAL